MNRLKLVLICCLVGLFSGIVIGSFLMVLNFVIKLNLAYRYLIFILPFSGLLMTYLYRRFGENSSRGNNLIIDNMNGKKENIPWIMAPLVYIGTVLTHLFGGSVGREGTGVQIGGVIGEMLTRLFKLSPHESKIILISGVAAGFASVFGTPLAGTIFAVEIAMIGSFYYPSLLPAFVAAFIGDQTVRFMKVSHTHFPIPELFQISIENLFKIVLLALAFGITSKVFVRLTIYFKNHLKHYFTSEYARILIGGSSVVLLTLIIGTNLYNNLSLGLLNDAFKGNVPVLAFGMKLLMTTLCLAAGYQGGEVTPLFVIGATLGATLSTIVGVPITVAASLGLTGVFAGATKAPIASFLLYLELFGNTNLIFCLFICLISVMISGKQGIYSSQVWND